MKAASRAQYTLTLTNQEQLTDAVKKDFGDGVRYIWAKLGEPHEQDGHVFSYLVAPFKFTDDDKKLEQKGAGVVYDKLRGGLYRLFTFFIAEKHLGLNLNKPQNAP